MSHFVWFCVCFVCCPWSFLLSCFWSLGCWDVDCGLWAAIFGLWSLVVGCWSLVYGLCSVVIGHWSLVFGHWSLVFDLWSLDFGLWSVIFGGVAVYIRYLGQQPTTHPYTHTRARARSPTHTHTHMPPNPPPKRYCVHFHVMQKCPTCLLRGNAVEHGHQRGIVIHGTHLTVVEDNVVYDVRGANYYIEDGNELHNWLRHNVAICPWAFEGPYGGLNLFSSPLFSLPWAPNPIPITILIPIPNSNPNPDPITYPLSLIPYPLFLIPNP
jgi:hypothetical protein